MTIAFDFDGTFTADTFAFGAVIDLLLSMGHCVIVVTARGDHREPTAESVILGRFGGLVPVLRSRDKPKMDVALASGYTVDVWVDNEPWKIARPS